MAWKTKTDLEAEKKKELEVSLRKNRDTLLSQTDWTQGNDSPLVETDKKRYKTYRQALRDITKQEGWPDNITWPSI